MSEVALVIASEVFGGLHLVSAANKGPFERPTADAFCCEGTPESKKPIFAGYWRSIPPERERWVGDVEGVNGIRAFGHGGKGNEKRKPGGAWSQCGQQ